LVIAIASYVEGYNLVINNSGSSSLSLQLGGRYLFKHCTLTNYSGSIRNLESASVYISNKYDSYDEQGNPVRYVNDLTSCRILNSIIYGNREIELFVEKDNAAGMHFQIRNNLIRFDDTQNRINTPEMDFSNTNHYLNNLLNGNPDFENPGENQLRIGLNSDAINLGDPAVTATVPFDITGTDRTDSPDAGAYKHVDLGN
jgi:hypothetical protein